LLVSIAQERRKNVDTVTITLDGVVVSGRQGMTILELAREMDVYIPTLCHDACLKPVGACRICLVEEEAAGRLLAACVTPIAPGMRIQTRSQTVLEARKVTIKLLMASHPESCVVCDKGNRCQLRMLAAEMGIGSIDYDRMPSRIETLDLNPFIVRDLNKCILCAKCIRADHELVVVGALDYLGRGFDAYPATLFQSPLEHSDCTFCGTCVSLCPTGALIAKNPAYQGTVGQRMATTCAYCGCGCALWVHTLEDRLVQVTPRVEGSANQATLCVRGHYGSDYLNHPERLRSPLIRKDGELQPTCWDDALDKVTQGLKGVVDRWGPESVGFLGSTQCTNEENYLLQKIARVAVGSPHVDSGARIQAMSSILGLQAVLGVGAATNPLEDLEAARVIFVIGAQPIASHPVASYHIKRAVRYKGARLIYANLLEDSLTLMADPWLRISPGAERALVMGLIRMLVKEALWRKDFVGEHLQGWGAIRKMVMALDSSNLEAVTGVDAGTFMELGRVLASSRRVAIVFGPGISTSAGALEKVKALAHLALLLGCLGVSGGGIYPLDKGANTQGVCDMGTFPEWLPGYRPVGDPGAHAELKRVWGKEPPMGPGWSLCEMLEAARCGKLKAMYILGENPARVLPVEARKALEGLELLIVQDLFLSETARLSHLILPGAGFAEKDGTYTSLERRIQRLRPAMKPPGSARADWWILAKVLRLLDGVLEYDTASDVMKEIATVVPQYGGVKYSRLEGGGIFWPCPDPGSVVEAIIHRGGVERLTIGLNGEGIKGKSPSPPDPDFPWIAVRGETHFHFGGGTRSHRSGRLNGIFPSPLVYLHSEDMAALGLSEGNTVRMESRRGVMKAEAHGREEISKGMAWVVPGPEVGAMSRLMDWQWDPSTKMPQLYTVSVRIQREGEKP
jgi:predicted molibdopterin-dependent oxidoreductase YjgC